MAEPATIELWQVVALLGGITVTVLSVYGALILRNRQRGATLEQRIFGTERDDEDEGFITETNQRLSSLDQKFDQHSEYTHTQLNRLERKMNVVVTAVAKETDSLDPDDVYQSTEPANEGQYPENVNSPMRYWGSSADGSSPGDGSVPRGDGGQPPENGRLQHSDATSRETDAKFSGNY